MDPAEEVLLDPLLVNPFFYPRGKRAILVPATLFESSGGVAPSACELNADERDDTRAKALTRRMRELDKQRLAKCDQSATMLVRSPGRIWPPSILLFRINSAPKA
jgi:hypothetical protein